VGAVLDRNGLRPSRFWVTDDGLVILASEVGVLDIDPAKVVRKGRLQPGRMFLVDIAEGRIIEDDEIKDSLASSEPYGQWLSEGIVRLADLPSREHIIIRTHLSCVASVPLDIPKKNFGSSLLRWLRMVSNHLVRWALIPQSLRYQKSRVCSLTTSRNYLPR